MKSKIYTGQVIHKRFIDKGHSFKYGLFMLFLDLDELDTVFKDSRFWSYETWNVASFRRSDYHGKSSNSLKSEIIKTVNEKTGINVKGPIRMLTHARIFGLCINPVTFYYCFDSTGNKVEVILAEIENTPWNERYCYAIVPGQENSSVVKSTFAKEFHVSPFFDMNIQYQWTFSAPEDELNIVMNSFKNGERAFNAGLSMKSQPATRTNLMKALIKYPWMTAKVIVGIYYQAFRIWLRGTKFYPNPNENNQRSLLFLKGDKK